MPEPRRTARNAFERVLLVGVALLLLFEEWGWEPLARLFGRLRALPLWARVEQWVQRLPPYGAVVAFFMPAAALFPIKLAALWLIGEGRPMLGLLLIVAAKIVGTAIVARLFQLTQPTLMTLPWFARWYGRWKRWKDGLIAWVTESDGWRRFRVTRRQLRRKAAGAWRRVISTSAGAKP